MLMIILAFLSGIAISATAAYYSIIGLVAIFPAAAIPIIAMGIVLEIGKLVAASWIYRNWKIAPYWIRGYMVAAVFVLMFITSMGIFGFLSKAHLEHSLTAGVDSRFEIATIDSTIESRERSVELVERQIEALDASMDRYIELGAVTKALDQRRAIEADRKELEADRQALENEVIELRTRRNNLSIQIQQVEVEVGPLRYIAELVYGEENAAANFDKTVRWVIILIVFVFDPLAIILLLAANVSLMNRIKRPRKIDSTPEIVYNTTSDVVRPEPVISSTEVEAETPEPVTKTEPKITATEIAVERTVPRDVRRPRVLRE